MTQLVSIAVLVPASRKIMDGSFSGGEGGIAVLFVPVVLLFSILLTVGLICAVVDKLTDRNNK